MWFSKKMQGTISVFLVLVLLPMFILTAVLIDGTIIFGAKNTVNDAGELAMGGALAHYDEDLLECYGLIAMDEKTNVGEKGKEYFESTLNAESLSSYFGFTIEGGSFIKLKPENTSLSTVVNTEIWQPYVMENQELEFMKYRAPVLLLGSNKLSALEDFVDVKAQADCIKKELDFEDEVADIQDLLNKLHDDLKNNYVNKNYPDAYKDNYIKNEFQDKMHERFNKLTTYYVARWGLESHIAPGDVTVDGSIEAAKEVVANIVYVSASPDSFESINKVRDYKYYVLDTNFTEGLDEDSEEYELMQKLEEDYADACETLERAVDSLYETTDNLEEEAKKEASKYYNETVDLYDLFERSENTCRDIEIKLQSAKGEREKWGDSIGKIRSDEKRAQFQGLYNNWNDLFDNDLTGSASDLSVLKQNMKECKEYMENMLKYMDGMQFCDISYPATYVNGNWSVISNKARSYSVTSKAEYNSAVNSITATFTYNPDAPAGSVYDVYNDNFYRNMDNEPEGYCCQVKNVSGKSEAEAKSSFKDIKKAQEEQEAEKKAADEALNKRLNESIKDKEIPSKISQTHSGGVDLSKDSGKGDLSSVENPVNDKKKAKGAGEKMLDGSGDIVSNLSTGALNIISDGFSSIYESAFEATYVTEMLSNRTSGVGDDDAVNLKGMDMKQNYLFQGEAEYVLWGDPIAKHDITYNETTIFTIRFTLNTISAFTNSKLRREAELMASAIGGVFPLSIPLITNLIIIACSLGETVTDQNYLVVKGDDIVLFHTEETWCCYPWNPFGGNKDNRKNKGLVKVGYTDYTWLFLFATMLGDGAGANARLVRTADCIELNLHDMLGANSILEERTMVQMSGEVGIKTYFLQNAATFVDTGDVSEENFKIHYNSALGY